MHKLAEIQLHNLLQNICVRGPFLNFYLLFLHSHCRNLTKPYNLVMITSCDLYTQLHHAPSLPFFPFLFNEFPHTHVHSDALRKVPIEQATR